jgi:Plasmid replication protein.
MADQKTIGGDERTRNWTFVLYPESAPLDWRDQLDDLHVPWIESPLHDLDTDANGEIKKEHWHILLLFAGKKSYTQAKEITDMLQAPIPQKCANAKGLVRYMAHLDNPDKHQYSTGDIIAHGGADVADYLKPTATDRYAMMDEIVQYIIDNEVTEFMTLVAHARAHRRDDWFPMLCDGGTIFITAIIKSNRFATYNRRTAEQVQGVDTTPLGAGVATPD